MSETPMTPKPLASQGRSRTMLDHARDALSARMTKVDLRLVLENTINYASSLEARLDVVHRVPQDNLTPAEVRLGQYGERTKTWSTATYDSGTERALYEIACGLRDTLEETRDQRNAARLLVAGLKERVAELEARLAEYERPADEDPIAYALTEQAGAEDGMRPTVRTDAPDFFQPSHTYTADEPFAAPEVRPNFRCVAIAEHPTKGSRRAFGFEQRGAGAPWVSSSMRDEEWADGWVVTEGGDR